MAKILDETTEFASKLKVDLTTDPTGVFGAKGTVYAEELAKVIPIESVEVFQKFNTGFFASSVLATGEAAVDVFAANPEVQQCTATWPMIGQDSFSVVVNRSKEHNIPNDPAGGTRTSYGSVRHTLEVHGTGKTGQLKAARTYISELAAKKLVS